MTTLRDLQENFQAFMLNKNNPALTEIATENESALERLNIYRNGYYLRLLEVSEKDFPCLKKLLGDELFQKIGRDYIDSFPSNHFSICFFNRHYSNYLISSGYESYYAEVAIFEWALTRAIDAPDAPIATFEELSQIKPDDWPYLQFTFHPSMQAFEFEYNSPEVVHNLMLEQEPPSFVKYDNPTYWMIWRANNNAYYESCDTARLFILNAIKQNKNFSEICEGLCEWMAEDEIPGYTVGILRYWLDKNIISTISVQEHADLASEEIELAEPA